ncbi:MAG: FKBP-type peptidyl-prolyl cis-trans isomerase [Candidatus Hydrogenedentes bacterium]|nr:FKBP-type peptidyl-prolyl cis-trans isomerase [Candidatus Hydrogenedentota bacterium]
MPDSEGRPPFIPPLLETDVQKVSYSIGTQIGTSMEADGIEIDITAFVQGIEDARSGKPLALTQDQMQKVMASFRERMMEQMTVERVAAGEKAAAEGVRFLEENAKKPGVKVLESGLQYVVVEAGNGETPRATDTVRTYYCGSLIDGTEFEHFCTYKEPAQFPVDGVIAGWTEALQLMHVGDKWRIFIPPHLAYGEKGVGRQIPPNATLIFDIELLEIVKPEAGTIDSTCTG